MKHVNVLSENRALNQKKIKFLLYYVKKVCINQIKNICKHVHVTESIVHYSNMISQSTVNCVCLILHSAVCVLGRPALSQTDMATCGSVFTMDGMKWTAPYPDYIWNRKSPWNHFYSPLIY